MEWGLVGSVEATCRLKVVETGQGGRRSTEIYGMLMLGSSEALLEGNLLLAVILVLLRSEAFSCSIFSSMIGPCNTGS